MLDGIEKVFPGVVWVSVGPKKFRLRCGLTAYLLRVELGFFSFGWWAGALLNVLGLESQYVWHPLAF